MTRDSYDTFESVKSRLDEIVDAVSDDELSLDEALSLYEEAVGLGLRASGLLEEGIEARRAEEDGVAAAVSVGDDASDGRSAGAGDETAAAPSDEAARDAEHRAGEPTPAQPR